MLRRISDERVFSSQSDFPGCHHGGGFRQKVSDCRVENDSRRSETTRTWPAVQNDRTGSRLYLLRRSKLTNKTPQLARDYAREALAWMVEDGAASRLDINAVRTGTDSLALAITIYQRDGNIHNIIFDDIWSELNG